MSWFTALRKEGIEVKEDFDLTNFSTMKLQSKGHLVVLKNKTEIITCLKILDSEKIKFRVLGKGSNSLLKEESEIPYLYLNLGDGKEILTNYQESYLLPASAPLSFMTRCAIKFGLDGWEYFTGIPGSLGGSVVMNAGTNLGEIGFLVKKIFLVNQKGEEKEVEIHDPNNYFYYRGSQFLENQDVIYSILIGHKGQKPEISQKIKDYLGLRAKNQPLKAWTCGCSFKNCSKDVRAGKLIDDLGLKGYQKGHFRISPIHANFIEHLGGGSYSEIREFTLEIMKIVKEKTGVELELEFKLW